MSKKLKIMCVFPEVDPFSKAGGLGDVGRSLPGALLNLGHKVSVITPLYGVIDIKKYGITKIIDKQNLVIDEKSNVTVHYYQSVTKDGLSIYFVDFYEMFRKYKTIYGAGRENERFWVFCLAVIKFIKIKKMDLDIIHCNDWQTALIPYFCATRYRKDPLIANISIVYTIHNLVFQFEKNWWEVVNGNRDDGRSKLPLFTDKKKISNINFAKRGIIYADFLNTVSETYAQEILTKNFGEDLYRILRNRKDKLWGIINGIDYKVFSPLTDPGIHKNYSVKSIVDKLENKTYLQGKFKLPKNKKIPLIGMASRISEQKGFDLLFDIIESLLHREVQFIIYGGGDKSYEKRLAKLMKKYPKKFAATLKFERKNVTQIYAGSDMFLMPSRFEPCGLGQLISSRYGSVPIARATGGIVDTVTDYKYGANSGNGFVFKSYSSYDFLIAIIRALTIYKNKKEWSLLVERAMNHSFSWEIPAKKYVKLFNKAIKTHNEK